MRFFQSESHSKPDDKTDDNATDGTATGTARSEPVPVPRSSDENDVPDEGGTHRVPDTADRPHVSGGFDDQDPQASPAGEAAAGRPHISTGAADTDPADSDRDGRTDDDPSAGDNSTRTGEPVDAHVVPDTDPTPGTDSVPGVGETRRDDEEPVFVEPVPQETAFGAATVGGAVAASELAARRETDDPDAAASVRPAPAHPTDAFGTPVTPVEAPADLPGAAQSPHDFGRGADASDDDPARSPDASGHAAQSPHEHGGVAGDESPHEFGRATDDRSPDEFGRAADDRSPEFSGAADDRSPDELGRDGEPAGSPSEFGRAHDGTDAGRDGFGTADERDPDQAEGFGPANAGDGEPGKPLRAEGLTATEGFGDADGPGRPADRDRPGDTDRPADEDQPGNADRLADENRTGDERAHSHAAETTALGVAAGVAAGAAVAGAAIKGRDRSAEDRDHDGLPDTGTPTKDHGTRPGTATAAHDGDGDGRPGTGAASPDRDHDGDGRPDTETTGKDRDRDGWPDAEPIVNDRDGDGRLDGESTATAGTAAVPIEPVPTPAGETETPATVDEPVELLPGEVPEQPALAAFFSEGAATDFRGRWREVQLRFVDDPAQAAADAGTLVDEVVAALNAAIAEQRGALGGSAAGQGDTEQLRVLVRRQRDFLDRILGL